MSHCACDLPDGRKAPRRGQLARAVEQREVKRREQDAAREEVQKFYAEQRAFNQQAGNPFQDDVQRKGREAKERAREAEMLDSLYQAERAQELAILRGEEEERIAGALARRLHEKERSEKEVQQLREQSVELRELAEKIRIARVNKERAGQLVEKAQIKVAQAEYDTALLQVIEAGESAAAAREAEAAARRRAQAVQARHVLEEQMAERQDQARMAEAALARERALVDEVVARIAAEDAMAASMRRQKQDDTKAYIAQFLEAQDIARQAAREQQQREEQKIQDYWASVREREAEEAARAAGRRQEADRMYERVRREMEEAQRAQDEEEQLINLLRQEEAEEKRRQEDAARKARAEQQKREVQQANQHQMRLKEERGAMQRAEEDAFRAQMMAKFAEDDRLEQLNAQKRRMKQVEHAREVQRMIDERRRMYAEQKAREEAELAAVAAEEARKHGIVEEERRRLLAEAAELKDYLPRGVLRDQADLDFINARLANTNIRR